MSMRNIIKYNDELSKLPFFSKERKKYEDLLYAELIKIAPKLIDDAYSGFKISMSFSVPLPVESVDSALWQTLRKLFEEPPVIYVNKLLGFHIEASPEFYDLDIKRKRIVLKRYDLYFVGATSLDIEIPPKDVPLKWTVDAIIIDDLVKKVVIQAK
ncbi:MAG: hypothetical protein NDF54_11155 [archaeon GB-1867-035]|nr:hypothetical protein [Candidatus Culexmicrobium profundum]